jgi:hypothetical protein
MFVFIYKLFCKMDVFVKPNEQRRACSYIVMARIGNRQHGALGEVERQNALFKERQKNLNQELGIGQYEIYIQPFVDYFKKNYPKTHL